MKKKFLTMLSLILMIVPCVFLLTACVGSTQHTHESGYTWISNTTHHWKECVEEDCGIKFSYSQHNWDQTTNKCTVCERIYQNNSQASSSAQYNVTLSSNNSQYGDVYGAGTYQQNETVTIAAVAKEGYEFVKWNDNDTNSVRSITVNSNKTLTATFQKVEKQYYLNKLTINNIAIHNSDELKQLKLQSIDIRYENNLIGGFNDTRDADVVGEGLQLCFIDGNYTSKKSHFDAYTDMSRNNYLFTAEELQGKIFEIRFSFSSTKTDDTGYEWSQTVNYEIDNWSHSSSTKKRTPGETLILNFDNHVDAAVSFLFELEFLSA